MQMTDNFDLSLTCIIQLQKERKKKKKEEKMKKISKKKLAFLV